MDTGILSSLASSAVMTLGASILAAAVQYGAPILFATLGEMVMERAGVLNLGVEGMMMVGALAAFLGVYSTGSAWFGFLSGCVASMLLSGVHGLLCLVFQGSQVVSGLALTIFGVGLANFLGTPYIGTITAGFSEFSLPFLSSIPLLGPVFFRQNALVYLSYVLPVLIWVMLMRTRFGLALRAAGENPQALRSAGGSPWRMRWAAVLLGGFMVGMGGAYLSLAAVHIWTNDLSSGRGWIAVALVIFAFWRPMRAVLGAYLFGGIVAFQLRLQALGLTLPTSILDMLPYLLTLLVLFVSCVRGRGRAAPAALALNLEPED